jgi:outer membrane protein OmpA-like peptidoglycan-associated protein/Mg-chelatase subunit ChlD
MKKTLSISKTFFISLFLILFALQTLAQDVKIDLTNKTKNHSKFTYTLINENRAKISILDKFDEEITGYTESDFKVTKKNKQAFKLQLTPLSTIGDTKIRIALLIDNSASMQLGKFIEPVKKILDNLINSFGNGFYVSVIMFDEKMDRSFSPFKVSKLPFTKDLGKVKDRYYYGYSSSNLSDGTYLRDAIKVLIETFQTDTMQKVEKNIAVVLSDGQDLNSNTSVSEIERMNKGNIVFYTVDFMHSSRESNRRNDILEKLAKDTKGQYFSPKDIKTLTENFKNISTKIVNLGYELKFDFKYPKPELSYKLDESEFNKRPDSYRSFPGLLMEYVNIKESFPLLNYFFFDKNSSEMLNRYSLFNDKSETKSFSEYKIQGGAIEHYYQLLNIYGERLQKYPEVTITVVGTTDGIETKKWQDLSTERANRVKNYWVNIWDIDSSRIKVISKKLPDIPSSSKIPEGMEENRRVEIICDFWDVIKPVTFIQNSFNVTPKTVELSYRGGDSVTIEKYSLFVNNKQDSWNSFEFKHSNSNKYQYDWKSKKQELPIGLEKLDFNLKVVDNGGDKAETSSISIPIKEITSEISKSENILEKKIEKVSLILFDFNSYDPGARNEVIMSEYVYTRLTDNSQYITVNGYTDIIGTPAYNLKLSANRAEKVSSLLVKKYSSDKIQHIGHGATSPLYSNDFPEGRFYNRTVQLILQNYEFEE